MKFRPLSGRSVICFSRDHLADGGGFGVEGHRPRLHLDGLGQLAGLQVEVDAGDLIDVQPDAGALGGLEALEGGASPSRC